MCVGKAEQAMPWPFRVVQRFFLFSQLGILDGLIEGALPIKTIRVQGRGLSASFALVKINGK